MRIKFIDHSFHKRTASSVFFQKILQTMGTVDLAWDDSWQTSHSNINKEELFGYDLVVVWQTDKTAIELCKMGLKNLLFVPMYDGTRGFTKQIWQTLANAKILNFSSAQHWDVQISGHTASAYFQYFMNPADFQPITDFSTIRPFFWQRMYHLNWQTVLHLLQKTQFEKMHLHFVLDPHPPKDANPKNLPEEAFLPPAEILKEKNITVTRWLENPKEIIDIIRRSNLYFAPRAWEGIGMSFLEAMSMGMPVVAPCNPTMSEYIVDKDNGYLYDWRKPHILDLSNIKEVGKKARHCVEIGYQKWMEDQERLKYFCTTPNAELNKRRFSFLASAPLGSDAADIEQIKAEAKHVKDPNRKPLVTVATVARNAKESLIFTLKSTLAQDMNDFEVVIIDGDSTDGTKEILKGLENHIDYYVSEPDKGIYQAMNKAVAAAKGNWILFMNAGDCFYDASSLRMLASHAPLDKDFVLGHHAWHPNPNLEKIRYVRSFTNTWKELQKGNVNIGWLMGLPCHQATLTKVELLKKEPFDESFRIAADHESYFRLLSKGASHYVSPVIACRFFEGGISSTKQARSLSEVIPVYCRHSKKPGKIKKFYRPTLGRVAWNELSVDKSKRSFKSLWEYFRRYPITFLNWGSQQVFRRYIFPFGPRIAKETKLNFYLPLEKELFENHKGLSHADGYGCWTDGTSAEIKLPRKFQGLCRLELVCTSFYSASMKNGATISFGEQTFEITYPWPNVKPQFFEFSPSQPCDTIILKIKNPTSPYERGETPDNRKLGLRLQSITMTSLKPLPEPLKTMRHLAENCGSYDCRKLKPKTFKAHISGFYGLKEKGIAPLISLSPTFFFLKKYTGKIKVEIEFSECDKTMLSEKVLLNFGPTAPASGPEWKNKTASYIFHLSRPQTDLSFNWKETPKAPVAPPKEGTQHFDFVIKKVKVKPVLG